MNANVPAIALPGDLDSGKHECVEIHNSKEWGRVTVFRKPATPDPFVNAHLTFVGRDADGRERFFISCLSGAAGATSFLITDDGDFQIYRWQEPTWVYSMAPESPDVLWVGGGSAFARLDLLSGRQDIFPTKEMGFITAGMAFDTETGKLFGGAQFALVSFDTRTRKTVRVYKGDAERSPDKFHYDHWRLPDGSYGFIMQTPGLSFLRWNPKTEEVTWQRLTEDCRHPAIKQVRWLKCVENGHVYLPHLGWLDGLTGEIIPHERPPEQEACWLGRRADTVYGVQTDSLNAFARIVTWDLMIGRITELLTIPDAGAAGCAMTGDGKLLSMDLYGTLRRYDLATGALELTRTIKCEHEHRCNVLLPAGNNRVVGTPFISMNFWFYNTEQGQKHYGGRVAGSYGQCDYAVKVGGRVYFAIYGGGQLTEYDPEKQTGFPRNPRVVAQNSQGQHGAGIATDGRVVWVAFKPKYGTLDGAMIRYDTTTGEASYRNGVIPGQSVVYPKYDSGSGFLVAGTTFLSDCATATPVHSRVFAVMLDPFTMELIHRTEAPAKVDFLHNIGPLDGNRWLMESGDRLFVFEPGTPSLHPYEKHPVKPDNTTCILYAGQPGRFVVQIGNCLHMWDAEADVFHPLATLADGFVQRWWVHGRDLTFDCGRHAALWDGALAPNYSRQPRRTPC